MTSVTIDQAQEINWKPVEQALGISGKMTADGVFKFGLPRRDLQVTVEGIKIKPTFVLGNALFDAIKAQNMEGIVAKQKESIYVCKRSPQLVNNH
ncbi:DUF1259 domain-containing protein [Paenibacillus sp. CGMCC 1.16610]|uniref:DUF1259 domain-containing protein n=1 Tax=Paenibacillus anseongense TaxID=2682845 RepID=A0ABW9UA16_9BACL|nr:DUF1259 domain-containing protein [Paenibacillus anseongense]MBA2937179.1 DUF1259 domain-containing protein [Paenibacillus sp. CGMCC 1.16610]MVQ36241.1 DUF1259 domain-containing protein [Paenibacillus anseongense]